jgi:Uma2 family endonuclease
MSLLPASSDFAPISIQLPPSVPMTDDQFFDFCQLNQDKRFERTAHREIIVMPLAGIESSSQYVSLAAQLFLWNLNAGNGNVTDSSGGFTLPNGAIRAPATAWVSPEQLTALSREQLKKFAPLCPYFAAEVMSPTDSLKATQEKMEEYIANGTRLGWLIVPDKKQVHVYRPGQAPQVIDNPLTLSGDPELPGFVLDLSRVWRD